MSRAIAGKPAAGIEKTFSDTSRGKLIITEYGNQFLVCLVNQNRLLDVQNFSRKIFPGKMPEKEDVGSAIGSVFLGKVKNVVSNLSACFVEIANKELTFLPLSETEAYYPVNRAFDGRILQGDELPVQIIRQAQKGKQASVTTRISYTGQFLVLTAGTFCVTYSKKLSNTEREKLEALRALLEAETEAFRQQSAPKTSPSYGIIVRTQAAEASQEAILQEFHSLRQQFEQLYKNAACRTCFSCLREAQNPWEIAFSHFSPAEYAEAVIDEERLNPADAATISSYFEKKQIPFRFYRDPAYSLFRLYSLESRLKEAVSRRVWLKSGGYLILDVTEALTVIDVNSGKYGSKKSNPEDTFRMINLEAAQEIALQLRLRNLSGIIIIDFINLCSREEREELLETMKVLVKTDKVPTRVVDITPLGLMELTRKKINKPLGEVLKL